MTDFGRSFQPIACFKKRLIWNGRYVNGYLQVKKFKYESLHMAKDLLGKGYRMWSFDLTSGYYHVELHRTAKPYVGFCWEGQCYQFNVLPFGLAVAPFIFTHLVGELTRRWRKKGMFLIHYLDDVMFAVSQFCYESGAALLQQRSVLDDLEQAGFLVNKEKCQILMVTSLVW